MIHSARPIVTPEANIVFCCFVLLHLERGDGRTTCAKTMIPTGRDCGLAEWIKIMFATRRIVRPSERIIDDICLIVCYISLLCFLLQISCSRGVLRDAQRQQLVLGHQFLHQFPHLLLRWKEFQGWAESNTQSSMWQKQTKEKLVELVSLVLDVQLIHSADPQSRPVVIIN